MANYIQDPNDSKKQVPGPKTDQHFDRVRQPASCTFVKQPHYVIINSAETVAFLFGSSASFSSKTITPSAMNSSSNYTSFGAPAVGTKFDINPCAWSGSSTQTVTFVYKGGLDGQGRP